MTPPMHLMDASFNMPMDMFMGTENRWMSNGAAPLDSWNASESQ
jgi:hypothetical protein